MHSESNPKKLKCGNSMMKHVIEKMFCNLQLQTRNIGHTKST